MKQLALNFNHQKSHIDPAEFRNRMLQHWIEELENIPNPNLRNIWQQLAVIFQEQIQNFNEPREHTRWTIFNPECGTGKTQGTVLYASLLAGLPKNDHPGVLIVTRLITDCNKIADDINRYAEKYCGESLKMHYGSRYAASFHSKQRETPWPNLELTELADFPVIVVTHKAYSDILNKLSGGADIECSWPYLNEWDWDDRPRKLLVVDEAIDLVEHAHLELNGLVQTHGAIYPILDRHPEAAKAIKAVIEALEREKAMRTKKSASGDAFKSSESEAKRPSEFIWNDGDGHCELDIEVPDFQPLIDDLSKLRFVFKRNDEVEEARLRKHHTSVIKDVDRVLRLWSYYQRQGFKHSFNSARLLIPPEINGVVVLDATGGLNRINQLNNNIQLRKPLRQARRYTNVTLHYSKGHNFGKTFLVKNSKQACSDLIQNLNERFKGQNRKVLIICHKKVEYVLQKYETDFEMMTTHWGAVDGSNEFRDCDTVVIFGLNYMPPYWSPNTFFALQGVQDDEWFNNPEVREFRNYDDIRRELEHSKLLIDVIQGVNRIQCRKTIDKHGNCPASEIYMLLPNRSEAEYILFYLQRVMPGVRLQADWNYRKHTRKAKASRHSEALMVYLKNLEAGSRVAPSRIQKEVGISPATMKRLIQQAKDTNSKLAKVMKDCQVTYEVKRQGRKQVAHFIKKVEV